jgi:hypothetical protein
VCGGSTGCSGNSDSGVEIDAKLPRELPGLKIRMAPMVRTEYVLSDEQMWSIRRSTRPN